MFSISVWLRSKINNSTHNIIYNDFNSQNKLLIGYSKDNNDIKFFNAIIQNNDEYKNTPDSVNLNNTWAHVVFVSQVTSITINSVTSTIFNMPIYVNGNFIQSNDVNVTGTSWNSTSYLRLGADEPGSSRMDGTIDETRLYNRALSPGEVTAREAGWAVTTRSSSTVLYLRALSPLRRRRLSPRPPCP
jgi:hypothetical protein